jgi:hypothetical protein
MRQRYSKIGINKYSYYDVILTHLSLRGSPLFQERGTRGELHFYSSENIIPAVFSIVMQDVESVFVETGHGLSLRKKRVIEDQNKVFLN